MQTLRFSYRPDHGSSFDLELTSDGDHITPSDLVLMGKYIRLLFATIRQIGDFSTSNINVDEIIRKIMQGDEE